MVMKKRGVFFTVDAVLATSIIVLTILAASSFYVNEIKTETANYLSNDLIRVFTNLKISEVVNSYIEELIAEGNITRLNNTILEQIGEFWSESNMEQAAAFARNITEELIPARFGIGIWVDNELIYKRDKPITKGLVSSRKIISGIAKEKPIEGYVGRVYLAGIKEKTAYSYVYFGGYTGDGDILMNIRLPGTYNNITEAYLELQVDKGFDFYINGVYSGSYGDVVGGAKRADSWVVDSSYHNNFNTGWNYIKMDFNSTTNNSGLIGGGFFRVKSSTDNVNFTSLDYDGTYITKKEYLPGIEGVINLYSSFFVPGTLNEVNMFLDYSTNYPLFINFGNITAYEGNETGDILQTVTNAEIYSIFNNDYSSLNGKTIPLRIGHYSIGRYVGGDRVSDTMVCTDLSRSMDTEDVPPDNEARLAVTKRVEKVFIDYVLNVSSENRIGLAGYYSSVKPGTWHDLSDDGTSLKDMIESYKTYGTDNSCFACALKEAEEELNDNGLAGNNKAIIIMSDGYADKCYDLAPCKGDDPTVEAIDIACDVHENSNITIYAIAFGIGADNTTLKNISVDCGGGLFFHSYNESGLLEGFQEIANDIMSVTFTKQKTVAEGVSSSISRNSYIELKYEPDISPYIHGKIPITVEQDPFGNDITTGLITIPENVTVTSAVATSYSGDEWTELLNVSNTEVFDLSSYKNASYPELGDPFLMDIPVSLLTSGDNNVVIKSSSGPFPENETGGSEDNRAIYEMLIESAVDNLGFGSVADGCTWTIKYEDNSTSTIAVPTDYSGSDSCDFENGVYDADDAIETSFYALLEKLDFDNNGLLDIKFEQESLSTESVIIGGVPSLWGPSIVQIKVWE